MWPLGTKTPTDGNFLRAAGMNEKSATYPYYLLIPSFRPERDSMCCSWVSQVLPHSCCWWNLRVRQASRHGFCLHVQLCLEKLYRDPSAIERYHRQTRYRLTILWILSLHRFESACRVPWTWHGKKRVWSCHDTENPAWYPGWIFADHNSILEDCDASPIAFPVAFICLS